MCIIYVCVYTYIFANNSRICALLKEKKKTYSPYSLTAQTQLTRDIY